VKIFEKQACFFKNPLLAGGINVRKHLRDGQNGGKSIHDFGWIMHPTRCKHEKAARKIGRLRLFGVTSGA
jgi:phage gp29-like protein